MEVGADGGSDHPEPDPDAEAVLFVVDGTLRLTIGGIAHVLGPGGYAFLPPGTDWSAGNGGDGTATFHWIRKAYERVDGIEVPEAFVTNETEVPLAPMPGTDGAWSTQRFVDIDDVRHDMQVNIVTFEPGRRDPVPGDPRDGARPLRARGQGHVPPQPGLGGGAGGRLHVAARVLPAGLLRRRTRAGSATCSTRTSTGIHG